jgi:hypothetical protein
MMGQKTALYHACSLDVIALVALLIAIDLSV